MAHASKRVEISGAEFDLMNCRVLTLVVSEEKIFNMLPRDHSCDILVKKVAAF